MKSMATKSSTSKNIKAKLAKKAGISDAEAEGFINTFLDLMTEKLINGEKVHLQEFGVFEIHEWKKNEIYNINDKSKESRPIKTISFKPSAKLKEKIIS